MHRTVIKAGQTEKNYWRDLWKYRELFFILAWRDVTVRYKQTVVGAAWALIQPLLTLAVFSVIFGLLAKLPSEGRAPYALMVAAAQLPWQFFANSLSSSSQSLVNNSQLISKVYFPRLIIPAGSVVTSLIDFLISFVILLAMMVWFQFWPAERMLVVPGLVLLAFLSSLGPGLLMTALTVRYRDFRFVIPFIVQFGLYISPVGFSSGIVPEEWRLLYSLNPMVGVIDGFRWAILGGESNIYWPGFTASLAMSALCLVVGVWYFRKTERTFADVI